MKVARSIISRDWRTSSVVVKRQKDERDSMKGEEKEVRRLYVSDGTEKMDSRRLK